MKPLVKYFRILETGKSDDSLKKEDFICPENYGSSRAKKHTFRNGVTCLVFKSSKEEYDNLINDESILNGVQRNCEDTLDKVFQYSDIYEGFIYVFIKDNYYIKNQ